MRPDLVVVLSPRFDSPSGAKQAAEPMLVQAVIAKLAVERLDEGVLRPFAGLDEMQPDAVLL
jgi:hypothetical protein